MLAHVLYILLVGEHHGWGLNVLSGNTGNNSKKLEVKKGGNIGAKIRMLKGKERAGMGKKLKKVQMERGMWGVLPA